MSDFGFGRALGRVPLVLVEDTLLEEVRVVLPGAVLMIGEALGHGRAGEESSDI